MGRFRNIAERVFATAFANPVLSRPMGALSDARLPPPLLGALIRAYSRVYKVDMSEVEATRFLTFNDFFTRRLRAGARPVATEPGMVVSPADSRVHSIGSVPTDGRLEQVKGRTYALEALLGSKEDAAPFGRGVHATLYLSPSMYHRVHSPVDGRVRSWRYVPGRLFPVNALAVRQIEGLFAVNERVSVLIDTDEFGPVAVVLVGATNVGRISLAFADLVTNRGRAGGVFHPSAPVVLRRGDELGAFNLGSTVVLLVADPRLGPAGAGAGDFVRMGEPLWRRT